MEHIVKRKGHKEPFDIKKVYASVYASCLSLRMQQEEAELIADKVSKEVSDAIKDKQEVTAHEIFGLVGESLGRYQPDAAYMYKTHLDIS